MKEVKGVSNTHNTATSSNLFIHPFYQCHILHLQLPRCLTKDTFIVEKCFRDAWS